ncbi:MAG: DNA damage-inducible protein D [Deferribacteres bacterium]|nr:DNA damage-inducible protein D [candidate division KSB1 bacterium]MCB9504170.1 DNA damage-inducible protein D [Deferribacteres bacterium]
MSKDLQDYEKNIFEKIKHSNEIGQEFWSARELSQVLEYKKWDKFLNVINRAIEACENSEQIIEHHFPQVEKMVKLGSGAQRNIGDIHLSRYACYLIVQNADPAKQVVALGQTYFAVQTRRQELGEKAFAALETEDQKRLFLRREMAEHNKKLADAARDAGVIQPMEYAVFQNHGYMGLYNGMKAMDIHQHKGLKKGQQILDHMGSAELAANLFRATQTEEKLKRDKIQSKSKANQTHYAVGKKVRQTIEELGGTMPEDLPAPESLKEINTKKGKQLE